MKNYITERFVFNTEDDIGPLLMNSSLWDKIKCVCNISDCHFLQLLLNIYNETGLFSLIWCWFLAHVLYHRPLYRLQIVLCLSESNKSKFGVLLIYFFTRLRLTK